MVSDKDDYEFIETTLPKNDLIQNGSGKIVLHQKAGFEYYNNDKEVYSDHFENFTLSPLVPFPNIVNYPPPNGIVANKIKAVEGSGGDYLSNEIFYRVALARERWQKANSTQPKFPTGHFHIAYIQYSYSDLKQKDIRDMTDKYLLSNRTVYDELTKLLKTVEERITLGASNLTNLF